MIRALRRHVAEHAAFVAAVAAILWHLRDFLSPFTLPARGDPSLPFQGSDLTPQWAPWLRVAADTLWRQGTLAFWNPFTDAGAPQFEAPQAGVISLATVLAGVVPLEAAVKWAMLAHVVAGMAGIYAMSRRLQVSTVFAAVGAFAFGTGTYLLDHFRAGHVSDTEAMCLTPWVMLFLWNALTQAGPWWRPAIAAGVVTGLEVLEGGSSVFVYTTIALGLLVVTCIGPRWPRRALHLGRVAAVAFGCFVATAALQLVPMLFYLGVTARRGGLTLTTSLARVSEVGHPLPTFAAMAMMSVGLVWLWRSGERRAMLWISAIVAVGIAAAYVEGVYAALWRFAPGFRYQRFPQRALVLVGLAGPLLIAAGAEGAWHVVARWRTWGRLIGVASLAAFVYDCWVIAPRTPPMADPSIERHQNHAMRWLADHVAGSRMHVWESPNRQWSADNITVPLGLEAITSYTPSEHRDYLPGDFDRAEDRSFLSDSYSNPARLWGMLNVRYVLSTTPRDEPGFRLVASVQRCPVQVCQPAKAAGPYIYENEQWLPRAWVVRHAIAIVGPSRPVFEATLDVLGMPEFDPARVAVLQFDPGAAVPQVDRVLVMDAGAPRSSQWSHDRVREALMGARARNPEPVQSAGFHRLRNNRLEFRAPADGWLIMSEKLALYPGWSASIDGRTTEIYRADGVLSATRVSVNTVVRASYQPRGFRLGIGLLTVMLAAIVLAEVRFRRRSVPRVIDVNDRVYASPTATV